MYKFGYCIFNELSFFSWLQKHFCMFSRSELQHLIALKWLPLVAPSHIHAADHSLSFPP